jgi:hypothetical protein
MIIKRRSSGCSGIFEITAAGEAGWSAEKGDPLARGLTFRMSKVQFLSNFGGALVVVRDQGKNFALAGRLGMMAIKDAITRASSRSIFSPEFSGAAVWSVMAWAQQSGPTRRIGVLIDLRESDQEMQLRLAAFGQSLAKLGWIDARNIWIDYRGGAGDIDRLRTLASELVALRPDVLLAIGSPVVAALDGRPARYRSCSRQLSTRSVAR